MNKKDPRKAGKIAQPLVAIGMNARLKGRYNVQCTRYLSKEDLDGIDLIIRDLITGETRNMQLKTGQGDNGDKYLCVDIINRNNQRIDIEGIIKKFQFGLLYLNDNKLYMPSPKKLLALVENELNHKRLYTGFHKDGHGNRIYDRSRYIRLYRKEIIKISKLFLELPKEILYGTQV